MEPVSLDNYEVQIIRTINIIIRKDVNLTVVVSLRTIDMPIKDWSVFVLFELVKLNRISRLHYIMIPE